MKTNKKEPDIRTTAITDEDELTIPEIPERSLKHAVKNPYFRRPKDAISIRVDREALEYFRNQALKLGIPYQALINLYLVDCMEQNRTMKLKWD